MGDLKLTYQVDGGDLVQAGEASSQMKMTLKKLGLPPEIIRKASVCMYEGEINMVIHADGGRVEVEVGMDAITIRLIDQGPGIPPDLRRRIFEPFFRLDTARSRDLGGTGLGLALVRAIAEVHGGSVSVEEGPAGGNQFLLRLPAESP